MCESRNASYYFRRTIPDDEKRMIVSADKITNPLVHQPINDLNQEHSYSLSGTPWSLDQVCRT